MLFMGIKIWKLCLIWIREGVKQEPFSKGKNYFSKKKNKDF